MLSYNPGYQSVLKDLKDSTRQRMVAIEFDYPDAEVEAAIVRRESGAGVESAHDLVRLAQAIRRLETPGLREVSSTRVLIAAARLAEAGLPLREAAEAAIICPLTDDRTLGASLGQLLDVYLAEQPPP